ncbi:MAG: prepilin peptidase [Planctomycetaceae bacterium]
MGNLDAQEIITLVMAGLFTITAALTDLRYRKIPNKLTIPFCVAGLIFQTVMGGWLGLQDAVMGFLMGFGVMFVLFAVGGGGGGDVKLMGALSVWLGWQMTLYVIICSVIFVLFGAIVSIVHSVVTRGFSRTVRKYFQKKNTENGREAVKFDPLEQRKHRRIMPFAIPVALATWFVMIWKFPQ